MTQINNDVENNNDSLSMMEQYCNMSRIETKNPERNKDYKAILSERGRIRGVKRGKYQ